MKVLITESQYKRIAEDLDDFYTRGGHEPELTHVEELKILKRAKKILSFYNQGELTLPAEDFGSERVVIYKFNSFPEPYIKDNHANINFTDFQNVVSRLDVYFPDYVDAMNNSETSHDRTKNDIQKLDPQSHKVAYEVCAIRILRHIRKFFDKYNIGIRL